MRLIQSFGTDRKELIAMINEPHVWPSFVTELEKIETLMICFPDFNIIHVPRACNQFSDFLAKTARFFHMKLHFIGCSIPVWLPSPPQAWVIEWPFDVEKKTINNNLEKTHVVNVFTNGWKRRSLAWLIRGLRQN